MEKVFESYCNQHGQIREEWWFSDDDDRIPRESTVRSLGLKDGDRIYALKKQKGGKPVIYVYPPEAMEVACKLSLTRDCE